MKTIRERLRELIAEGIDPDQATQTVLSERIDEILGELSSNASNYQRVKDRLEELADFARPTVRDAAHKIGRSAARTVEDRALEGSGAGALDPSGGAFRRGQERLEERREKWKNKLATTVFKTGDGTRVSWQDATRGQHKDRIAWQQGQVAAIGIDIRRHECAIQLLDEHGAETLRNIPDWQDLLAELCEG